MDPHARVDVIVRIRDLSADARRAADQAVDERRLWTHEDRLWREGGGRLSPIVVLHRDHEYFPRLPIMLLVTIVSSVVGMDGEAAPRQRASESQYTRAQLMSHLQHGPTSDKRRWSVPRSESSRTT